MSSASPTVSVLMPAYNHEAYVAEAVESVWRQTFKDMELIVIDDGSTDRTPEILAELAARSPIPMTLLRQTNAGISATLGRALAEARGEWVCILASDDFYAPNFVARNLQEMERIGSPDAVLHSNAYLIEPGGRISGTIADISRAPPLSGKVPLPTIVGHSRIVSSTIFLRRQLLDAVGGFDPAMVAEDCDLQLRLAPVASFHYIDEPIFYSRYNPNSLGRQPWKWGESILQALAKHRDALGDDYGPLVSDRCAAISASCFEYGAVAQGLRWARRAVAEAPDARSRLMTFGRLAAAVPKASARYLAFRTIGRERLVKAKRGLQRRFNRSAR